MIDIATLKENLEKHLSVEAGDDYLIRLKEIVNYNDETQFTDLHKLLTLVKYAGSDDDAIYCVTTLYRIKEVITMGEPPNDSSKSSLTIQEYIDWLIENKQGKSKPHKRNVSSLIVKEKIVKKPIKLGDRTIRDWLELTEEMEIVHNVTDRKQE